MDLSNSELHFVGYLNSADLILKRADSIIDLAQNNPNNESTLAACATIVLVVALGQGLQTKYSESAEVTALESDTTVSNTKAFPFVEEKSNRTSLWYRVQQLPYLLSDNKLELDSSHPQTKALKELIDTRNQLVHISEKVSHLTGPSDKVRIENNHIIVEQFFPLSKWETIKLEAVKRFREAVAEYFACILFPDDDEIREGSILTRA